jgi:hypothetical protein
MISFDEMNEAAQIVTKYFEEQGAKGWAVQGCSDRKYMEAIRNEREALYRDIARMRSRHEHELHSMLSELEALRAWQKLMVDNINAWYAMKSNMEFTVNPSPSWSPIYGRKL